MTPGPGEAPWQRELDELYAAFAGVRRPRLRSDNPRSYDAEWIGRQPLRELSPELVNDFAFELGFSVGDAEDIRYLLPRLFDLMARGELRSLYSPDLLAQKLTLGGWEAWSPREHAAVRGFLAAWFAEAVARRDATMIRSIVTDFGAVLEDLSPLLARVRARDDVAGVFALLLLAEAEAAAEVGRRLTGKQRRRWRRAGERAQLRRWLQEPATLAQVEAVRARVGLVGPDGEDLASLFDQVTYCLQVLGAAE